MRPITFNPNVNFKQQLQVKDTSAMVSEPGNVKKSGSVKEDIANVAKTFTTLSEFTKSIVKATVYGIGTAVGFLAGGWVFTALPKIFKKGGLQVLKHPVKSISTKAKVLTGLATACVVGYHLVKGKLNANQRTADVDHQLKTGHRV